ncbi:MAG: peptidylprolyl isomerase [Pyrinomonadaceae bacterium]|nr:peptidylprolyl isomerase [Pyrinomonadaceae bacterium]MBP9109184.1 peptidylprolyl isomerase [Pyrinomonadaceae bacterium]
MISRILILAAIVTAGAVVHFSQPIQPIPTASPEIKKINERPVEKPAAAAEPFDKADVKMMASKCVKLESEAGDIEMEMFPEVAPESVRNFLNLVATGLLDTTTFSRVVPGFVIQGGNIWSREGGVNQVMGTRARRKVPDEPSKILHERGIVSMARTDEPNSATSNFFILVGNGSHLDGSFAAFGRVTKGMEVADVINKAPVVGEKPEKPVRIRKASITGCMTTPTK